MREVMRDEGGCEKEERKEKVRREDLGIKRELKQGVIRVEHALLMGSIWHKRTEEV